MFNGRTLPPRTLPPKSHHGKTQPPGYADVYEDYIECGWTPVPLPAGEKMPPPKGYTGAGRKNPRDRDYDRWAAAEPGGNTAIVMPDDVIGMDVDVYHGADKTLKALYHAHGSLPVTPETTSRDDGSGIGFYRMPPGTVLKSKIPGGIEIIQYHHRYAVVWPSIHPDTKRMYDWWLLDEPTGIPVVTELPRLPDRWVRGLAGRAAAEGTPYDGDTGDWLGGLAGRVPLRVRPKVRRAIRRAELSFGVPGGRYDAMVAAVARLVHLGAEGVPVGDAVEQLGEMYGAAVGGERDAEDEFWRAVEGAVAKFGGQS